MSPCNCPETHYTDLNGIERRIFHPLHSCEYVKHRNAVIPFAYAKAMRTDANGMTRRLDVAAFMRAMNDLTRGETHEERDPDQ